MKIEDRLRKELSDTAEHLALDVDTYEHVLDLGRRRRRFHQLAAAAGTAALIGSVVVVLAVVSPGPPAPIVSPSTTTTTGEAVTTTAPAANTNAIPALEGVLMATPDEGIVLIGAEGTTGRLTSDLYYESIAWVISDGAGGIVFQHEVTPLPWAQGTILHLPAAASHPIEVIGPDPGTYLRPLDIDRGLLIYRVDSGGSSEVRAIDLVTQAVRQVIPSTEFLIGASADEGVVVSAYGGDCPSLEFFSLDGTAVAPPPAEWSDCQIRFVNDIAFSRGFVYTIEDGEGRNLVRRALATGETASSPVGDAWSLATLPDGTVAAGGTAIVVGRFEGDVFVETSRVPGAHTSFTLASVGGFPADATLGSGSDQLPCTPMDLPPVSPQGLPQAVEDKRRLIFEMAASCDLEGLANMALSEGTVFSYGAESDPLRSWVRSARDGFDVMAWIVRLFNAAPAIDDARTYAWPAVHATDSEADWQALSGILSAAEFEQYSLYRDSGWLGLRIGIAEDGTWRYVVAGD